MKTQVVADQANAIEVLANLLHVKRVKVASLVARKRHPLPLPPTDVEENRYRIDDRYLRRLRRWVVEEKLQAEPDNQVIDFNRIERELARVFCPEQKKQRWSIEDVLENGPPGDFLG